MLNVRFGTSISIFSQIGFCSLGKFPAAVLHQGFHRRLCYPEIHPLWSFSSPGLWPPFAFCIPDLVRDGSTQSKDIYLLAYQYMQRQARK